MASRSDDEKRPQKQVTDERLAARPKLPMPVVAGISAGIAGAILVVAGILWWAVKKKLLVMPLVLLVLGVAGLAVYVVTNRQQLRGFWQQRTSRQFVNSAAFAVFVVGILVLVNIIGARHFLRHDFTQNKQYSLSEQTRKVLDDLKQPLEIIAFVSPDYYNSEELRARLREYDIASPKTKLEIIDPKTALDKVREYNVQFDGTIILKYGDKKEEVTGGSEEQLTSAILSLTKGEKTKIYFLSGHGERRLDGYGEDGIADFKRSLENQQFEVKELVLMKEKEPQVPSDCAVLCIIGPQQPLLKKEIDAINKYLSQGGNAFICLEIPPAPNLKEIIASHGVTPLDGVVFDPTYNFLGNIGMPLVVQPEDHDITRNLQGLFFPGSRALEVTETPTPPQYPGAPPPPPQKASKLLQTSDSAWLDSNFQPGKRPVKDAGERSGRLCLAAAVDEGKKEQPPQMPGMPPPPEQPEGPGTRMVIVGDSDFLTRSVANIYPTDVVFGLKAIAWLAKEQKLVSIPPKERPQRNLALSSVQLKVSAIIVFALPLLVLLAGIAVWVLRRRG